MRTIWSLWQDAIAENRSNPAYLVEEAGEWREVSQKEAATAVDELAHGLLALGVKKGDSWGILARTSNPLRHEAELRRTIAQRSPRPAASRPVEARRAGG